MLVVGVLFLMLVLVGESLSSLMLYVGVKSGATGSGAAEEDSRSRTSCISPDKHARPSGVVTSTAGKECVDDADDDNEVDDVEVAEYMEEDAPEPLVCRWSDLAGTSTGALRTSHSIPAAWMRASTALTRSIDTNACCRKRMPLRGQASTFGTEATEGVHHPSRALRRSDLYLTNVSG